MIYASPSIIDRYIIMIVIVDCMLEFPALRRGCGGKPIPPQYTILFLKRLFLVYGKPKSKL